MSLLNFVSFNWKILTIIFLVIIVCLSLNPLQEPNYHESIHDKLYHIVAYLFLSIPISLKRPKYYLLSYLIFILLGGLIELLQPYFNRQQELADFIANIFGISIGAFLGSFARKRYFKLIH